MARVASLLAVGLLSGHAALAEDGAPQAAQPQPAQPPCSFPCFFRSAQPAPTPVAEPQPAAEATPDAKPEPAKPRSKPVHALTIAADPAEATRLKVLSSVVKGQPIRIVKTTRAAPAATDFTVKAELQPAGAAAPAHEAKLFTEALHIVAGPGITSVEDLKNRVVSFGPEGSASQAAARKAFAALDIPVKETPLDLDNALDGAATGDIDAVVVLAPQPLERLKMIENASLHLVSWPDHGALPEGAVEATIDPAHYPGLAKSGDTIHAVGVDAVLRVSPKAAHEPAARKLMSALAQHSAVLTKHGFDLIKADSDSRGAKRYASAERR